jgi:hypothetical protein
MQTEQQDDLSSISANIDEAIRGTQGILRGIEEWLGGTANIQEQVDAAIGRIETLEITLIALLGTAIGSLRLATQQIGNARDTALGDVSVAKAQALREIAQAKLGSPHSADSPALKQPGDRGYTVGRLTVEE